MAVAVRRGARGDRRPWLLSGARSAERVLASARSHLLNALDWAERAVRLIELRNDPDAQSWLREVRAKLADGTLKLEAEKEPDPREFVAEWRRARPA